MNHFSDVPHRTEAQAATVSTIGRVRDADGLVLVAMVVLGGIAAALPW